MFYFYICSYNNERNDVGYLEYIFAQGRTEEWSVSDLETWIPLSVSVYLNQAIQQPFWSYISTWFDDEQQKMIWYPSQNQRLNYQLSLCVSIMPHTLYYYCFYSLSPLGYLRLRISLLCLELCLCLELSFLSYSAHRVGCECAICPRSGRCLGHS